MRHTRDTHGISRSKFKELRSPLLIVYMVHRGPVRTETPTKTEPNGMQKKFISGHTLCKTLSAHKVK